MPEKRIIKGRIAKIRNWLTIRYRGFIKGKSGNQISISIFIWILKMIAFIFVIGLTGGIALPFLIQRNYYRNKLNVQKSKMQFTSDEKKKKRKSLKEEQKEII